MTVGEKGNKNYFEIESFAFFLQFSFRGNQIAQSSHYCSSLVNSGIQLFVPSLMHATPRQLKSLYLLYCRSIYLQRPLFRFFGKTKYFSFGRAYFHSGGVACIGKAIFAPWRPDESRATLSANSRRLVLQYFRSWHTYQLCCICRSNLGIQ